MYMMGRAMGSNIAARYSKIPMISVELFSIRDLVSAKHKLLYNKSLRSYFMSLLNPSVRPSVNTISKGRLAIGIPDFECALLGPKGRSSSKMG
jgi:hypothetical protein